MTPADLIAFEADIAERFNRAEIPHPVHLSGGNEQQLIDYFAAHHDAARGDWVCGSWRMHYHCLLAEVPSDEVRAAILAGRSITLCFLEHRVVSSAIVGGILPIAVGIAVGLRRQGSDAKVHVFCGDMTAVTGAYHEATTYARRQALPISFVVEDNGLSVMTDTQEAWGAHPGAAEEHRYFYKNKFPHAGAGVRVDF
jgi:pyruvate dehydrogenase E1 component alpha subunit